EPVEGGAVVGPEPAPGGEVVASVHHVDRVHLDPACVGGEPRQRARREPLAARTVEVLALDEERCDRAQRIGAGAHDAAGPRAVAVGGGDVPGAAAGSRAGPVAPAPAGYAAPSTSTRCAMRVVMPRAFAPRAMWSRQPGLDTTTTSAWTSETSRTFRARSAAAAAASSSCSRWPHSRNAAPQPAESVTMKSQPEAANALALRRASALAQLRRPAWAWSAPQHV